MRSRDTRARRVAPIATPTVLKPNGIRDLAGALNILLADILTLYLKTKIDHVGRLQRVLDEQPSWQRAQRGDP